ncbi:glucose-6-phosphate dehydrogenase [Paradevosia shaoguanensis]|uniref:Glucose-6-phosphate 1-dehydrogenase n=1 Tax=Paradevosia shaoguanensis TaxID=1335043 RepID=A0AA41QPG4_9HYPH|nr:glucose-6-phosphate dehydrogenase [Paradevosia shaoguanensis]KFL26510.1 glucose-6-phosphate dehydrogenase [Devosia sp. 17-2-E-8]QMV03887.1 glucose-6-phosphate dehydrogenase [Devosia sp. D6-9]CDP50576.1 Glucose-6-phosphate 1-dehydrogenase [Devosia sp. DBB001]MCF1744119.1 glucose-6-phosphate dehydrogenase [Paradevosia shaoguanensis]MCI0128602.1 glucose-6-phosphate dehydrogenase [Paradevosia shaoguanensis]
MSSRIIPVPPFDYVVFGATGDLAKRKLIPALYYRFKDGQFDEKSRIIGVSRSPLSDADFQKAARDSITEFVEKEYQDKKTIDRFVSIFSYVANDVTDEAHWADLSAKLREDPKIIRAFYLAVAPNLFGPICEYLSKRGYYRRDARVVLEKPLGHDLASSEAINNEVASIFEEDQVYRIDHYLGKETVQNLLALRFANKLFEPIWNSANIDHVQITVSESVGAGTRGYYDESGALRDMIQNHIMQLVCLVAMEPPASDDANALRDEKLKVLRSLKPITGSEVAKFTVRGQYRGVTSETASVKGYQDELPAEKKGSRTETFVALKAEIENWRWAGVPFYLRTGKRMANRVSEIVIQFRQIPHSIFEHAEGAPKPNKLVIRLQPDEGVKLFLMIKDPGPGGMRLREVPLNLSFAKTFAERTPEAYERLLLDVIRGSQTLFMRRDELEAAWKWVDPIREAWDASRDAPQPYTAGTWGPTGSIALIERDGRTWHEDDDA